jgi:hypothetical protein
MRIIRAYNLDHDCAMLTRVGFFCHFYHALTLSFFLIELYNFFSFSKNFFSTYHLLLHFLCKFGIFSVDFFII